MKVGFIGLGHMGLPMAANLVRAGYETYGLNRSKGKEQAFAAQGGKTGYTLPELVREVDVVMTCLPLPEDVREVYLGNNGVVESGRAGQILIDFSTVSPGTHQEIERHAKEKGMEYLDAPVSGGTVGAKEGTLSIMVGGSKAAFAQAQPLFNVLGKNIYHLGEVGSGTVVKLINQLMVGIHTQAVAEALLLAEQTGIAMDQLVAVLRNSFAQSVILERHYDQFIRENRYEPGFALNLLLKDMNLASGLAEEKGIRLSAGENARQKLSEAAEEFGTRDMSAMYLYAKKQFHRDKSSGNMSNP